MSRSQQRVCRLCEFPAADSGVRVEAIDAQKLAEWCKQKLGTELEIATDAVICQFCIWDARFDNENTLGAYHTIESEHDWWTGIDSDHNYQEYFYNNPIIQPCKVELKKISIGCDDGAISNDQNCSEEDPHPKGKFSSSAVDATKRQGRELQCDSSEIDVGCVSIDRKQTGMHTEDAKKCEPNLRTAITNEKHIQVQTEAGIEVACIYCGVKYTNIFKLRLHINKYHAEIRFKCRHIGCNQYFLSQLDSDEHFNKLHQLAEKLKKFQCSKCSYKTSTKQHYQIHFQRVHGAVKKLKCQKCGKEFKNEYSLNEHLKTIHQLLCTCEHCGKNMLKIALRRHISRDLCNKVPSLEYRPKVFECKYDARCTQIFRTSFSLKRHVIREHQGVCINVPCIYCGEVIKNEYSLVSHINRAHAAISFRCRFYGCKIYFLSQVESDEHFNKEHLLEESLKHFQCPKCGYKSKNKSSLRKHFKRKHYSAMEMLKCQECEKDFKNEFYRKQHLRAVHQLRCTCKHCGKTVPKSLLRNHLLKGLCKKVPIASSSLLKTGGS